MIIQCIECMIKVRSYHKKQADVVVIGCCSVCFKHALNRLKVEGNDQKAFKIARLYEPNEQKWEELYSE